MSTDTLWSKSKTAFVCSQRCPGAALLRATEWVKSLDPDETTLLGGWHTPVEREVLRLALRRGIPTIIAEARSPRTILPPAWRSPLAAGRLQIVHPVAGAGSRITAAQASERTRWVIAKAETLVVAHASPGGTLAQALQELPDARRITRL
jgi:hypothetical protein